MQKSKNRNAQGKINPAKKGDIHDNYSRDERGGPNFDY